jgi:tetratricopeptide (TPR) repeat protein
MPRLREARLREARLRHIKYYIQLARESRTDPDRVERDLPNILIAVDNCIKLEEWQLLTSMADAVGDFLLKRSEWSEYSKLNRLSADNDHTQGAEEKADRLRQLGIIEEFQGNYAEAIVLYEQSLQLYGDDGGKNVDARLDALQRITRLLKVNGRYNEAVRYSEECVSLTRQYGLRKDEADALYGLAVLYEKTEAPDDALAYCEASLYVARYIGYIDKIIDILMLRSSLLMTRRQFHDALAALQEALEVASRINDAARVRGIGEQMAWLGGVMKKNIFISYNHQDRPFVARLAQDLKAAGLPVWWDQWEIKFGDSIIQKVSDGIDKSAYLVAVLSPHSVQSDWVRREIGSVLMRQLSVEKGVVVLPLLLADCEVPALLREIKWVDFRGDYAAGLNGLLDFFISNGR